MNLYKTFKRTPMPEHDDFKASLKKRLFPESSQGSRKSWLWTFFPSTGAVALAVLMLFLFSTTQNGSVALADAISNTVQFTPSEELVERTVNIEKHTGVGAAPSDQICFSDGIEGSCDPETYTEQNTWWLYGENARMDTVRTLDDSAPWEISYLISDYDQVQCGFESWASAIFMPSAEQKAVQANASCRDIGQTVYSYMDMQLTIPRLLTPFENGGSLELSKLAVKPYVDPDGDTWDVLITWESDTLLQDNPRAMVSTGPSGWAEYGYPVRSWLGENGKFQNEVIYIDSEDLRRNARNSFYPNDSEKTYIQIWDDTLGRSDTYLLNVDDYTLTPASDEELLQSQKTYQELAEQFAVSLERMERDYEFFFSNVLYLEENLSRLKELDEKTEGDVVTLSYSVPADLGFYGGTNNALITKASFTIDQNTKRITEYSFYDADGTDIEHLEIAQSTPSVDPESLFTKKAWASSL